MTISETTVLIIKTVMPLVAGFWFTTGLVVFVTSLMTKGLGYSNRVSEILFAFTLTFFGLAISSLIVVLVI